MSFLDWVVVAVYMASMLAIGFYYAGRTKSEEEYLLGGRNMGALSVGLSLFASLLSTVSYLAVPGEMIEHGPMMFTDALVYPIAFGIIGYSLIPLIMKLPVTTAYEILERRFGLEVRLLGSVFFLTLRLVWMAVILYVTTEKVLVPLLGLPKGSAPYAGAVLGLITVTYTSLGGLRAVVITDAIQSLILLGGSILTLIVVTHALGGVAEWWPTQWADHWDEFRIAPTSDARVTVVGAMLTGMTWWICTYGSDQIVVQRFLATRDAHAARVALGISLVTGTLATVLLALVGLALLAYFQLHSGELPVGLAIDQEADRLFPHFIAIGLPSGISGLVIAGLMAAAMSTLSSGITSTCSVIAVDFMDRLGRARPGADLARRSKIISWILGLVTVFLSTLVGYIPGNLVELCNRATNLLVVPMFMLFFMAMFVPWATPLGAVVAAAASTIVAVGIAYFQWFGLSFVWIMPMAFVAGAVAGPLASLLPIMRAKEAI